MVPAPPGGRSTGVRIVDGAPSDQLAPRGWGEWLQGDARVRKQGQKAAHADALGQGMLVKPLLPDPHAKPRPEPPPQNIFVAADAASSPRLARGRRPAAYIRSGAHGGGGTAVFQSSFDRMMKKM